MMTQPQISPDGQWVWNPQENRWVPNPQVRGPVQPTPAVGTLTGQPAPTYGGPHLGTPPQNNRGSAAKVALWVGGVFLALLIVGIIGAIAGSGDSDSKDPATNAGPSAPVQTTPSPEPEPEPVDTDGDGVNDEADLQPEDPKVQTRDDVDADKDGVPDFKDAFPKDPKYSKDSDGDRVANPLDDFPNNSNYSKDTDGDAVADSIDAFPGDPNRSKITLAMENALESAQDYLDLSPFSRQGLIDQLSSQYGAGFRTEDATWAVSQLSADWKKQAVRAAKDYLALTSFSRQGLIEQLSSSYGAQFTMEEATYAVNKIGL